MDHIYENFHIVYGKKEREWALLLSNLMAENGISASYSDEAKYNAQELSFSNQNKVIFVGKSKITKDHIKSIVWKFDKFGIKYGWIGNSAVILTEDSNMNSNEFRNFSNFVNETGEKINKKISVKNSNTTAMGTGALIGAGALLPLPLLITSAALLGTIVVKNPKQDINTKNNDQVNTDKKSPFQKMKGRLAETVDKIGEVAVIALPENKKLVEAKWEIAIRLFFIDGLETFVGGK